MIARVALSPEGIRSLNAAPSPADVFARHASLCEALEAHGYLIFASKTEFEDLKSALREASPEVLAKWSVLLRRFSRARRLMAIAPPCPRGLDEIEGIAELRAGWVPKTDVVVVPDGRANTFDIGPTEMSHLDTPSGIEAVRAPAAAYSQTIERLKRTRDRQVLKPGERRDVLWRDALMPIARVASTINIVDRYIFKSLADLDGRGRLGMSFVAWILDRIDREAIDGCEVTLIGWDQRRDGRPADAEQAAALVRTAFVAAGGRIAKVDVVTAQPAAYLPHDRHISTSLNVGVSFMKSFEALTGDTLSGREGLEYSYRFDPDAVEKLQTSEQRFREDPSARQINAYTR